MKAPLLPTRHAYGLCKAVDQYRALKSTISLDTLFSLHIPCKETEAFTLQFSFYSELCPLLFILEGE